MDPSTLNTGFPSLDPEQAAWSQPELPCALGCPLPPFLIGPLPGAPVHEDAFRAGMDRGECEGPESWPLGSLNIAAIASDPLTGVGHSWVPERRTPFTDVGPWHVPDTPGWPDSAVQTDLFSTVDLTPWPPSALINGKGALSRAQPVLSEGYPLMAGLGMADNSLPSCDPLLPPSDCNDCVDPPAQDLPTVMVCYPYVSGDFDARDDVPSYRAYQEFIQQNPGWLADDSRDRIAIQVMTQSAYVSSVWLGDPWAASAFDLWYETYWIPLSAPAPGQPGQDQSFPAPEPALPGLPIDQLIIRTPASDLPATDPVYLAFRKFLGKNPGWLIEQGGEVGTCAITQSRYVASIWLSGSQEALAFDAWYERERLLELDLPDGSHAEDPIVAPLAPAETGPAAVPPLVGPTAAFSRSFRSDPEQVHDRTQPALLDRTITLLASTPADDFGDRVAADPLPMDQARPRRLSDDGPAELFAPRKVLDLPDWLPLHLRA